MNPILNSSILEMWKKEMFESLMMIYGDKLDKRKLVSVLESKVKNIERIPVCKVRNQYEFKHFEAYADDLPNIIRENNVSILGNGMMTYNADDRPAIQSRLIEAKMKSREVHKKRMLQAMEEGDEPTRVKENNLQNKDKSDVNSTYGVATMNGSFVSNIDCGSAITAQGRHLISETLWCVEKLIGANNYYDSIGEYILFVKKSITKDIDDKLFEYITYIPSFQDCSRLFMKETLSIPMFHRDFNKTKKSFYIMLKSFTERQRILFYYKNNIYDLIAKNPKIRQYIVDISRINVEFTNPYNIPDELKGPIENLKTVVENFVYVPAITYKRLYKYQTKKRRAVLVSDTDSVMPCVYSFVKFCEDILRTNNIEMDEENELKFVNVIVTICHDFIKRSCWMYVDTCNGSVLNREKIKFKNELYYRSMIVYSSQKKIYSGICLLQEGKRVPTNKQLMSTGRELNAATKCEEVMDRIRDIIENDILRAKRIDMVGIIRKKRDIERMIEEDTRNGLMIYGDFTKYKNPEQYKDLFRTTSPRTAYIWNKLYPQVSISEGVGMYVFKTSLLSMRDFDKIKDDDIRYKLKDIIFNAYGKRKDDETTASLSNFGLKYFAVSEEAEKIPDWVIPFIDIDDLKLKQLRPLTALSPSLGLNVGIIKNSTQKTQTNMISF